MKLARLVVASGLALALAACNRGRNPLESAVLGGSGRECSVSPRPATGARRISR